VRHSKQEQNQQAPTVSPKIVVCFLLKSGDLHGESNAEKHGKRAEKLTCEKKLGNPLNCLVSESRPLQIDSRDATEACDVDDKNAQQGKSTKDVESDNPFSG
jgi:hypothetical protein